MIAVRLGDVVPSVQFCSASPSPVVCKMSSNVASDENIAWHENIKAVCLWIKGKMVAAGFGQWLRKHDLHMWQGSLGATEFMYVASRRPMANP